MYSKFGSVYIFLEIFFDFDSDKILCIMKIDLNIIFIQQFFRHKLNMEIDKPFVIIFTT